MALKESIYRFKVPPIRSLGDAEQALHMLASSYELLLYFLEQQASSFLGDSSVDPTAPTNGQYLGYDDADSQWEPKSLAEGEGIDLSTDVNGNVTIATEAASAGNRGTLELDTDLGGTAGAPNVVGIQGNSIEGGTPADGEILRWNNGGSQWDLDGEELSWGANSLLLSANATASFRWSAFSQCFVVLPDSSDERAFASFVIPRSWLSKNLTLEYLIGGDGTAGDCRTVWGVDDSTVDNTTVTGVTSTLSAFGPVLVSASTTISLTGSAVGDRATLVIGRDPDHADDDIADNIRLYLVRLYRTQ